MANDLDYLTVLSNIHMAQTKLQGLSWVLMRGQKSKGNFKIQQGSDSCSVAVAAQLYKILNRFHMLASRGIGILSILFDDREKSGSTHCHHHLPSNPSKGNCPPSPEAVPPPGTLAGDALSAALGLACWA
jgi:hypothetical protein